MKCSICGEYQWSVTGHKCNPVWYCIHAEDYGNDVIPDAEYMMDEGWKIYATDPKEAAVKFAEKYQANNSWYPGEMQVLVMDYKEEKIWKFEVLQEPTPSYWVSYTYEPTVYDAKHEPDPELDGEGDADGN